MASLKRTVVKATSHLPAREPKPVAHVAPKNSAVWMVNGRLVGKTLADPDIQEQVKAAVKKKFPNREATVKEMQRRGVLTRAGKLTKNYGG